jgi:hypothetical protein
MPISTEQLKATVSQKAPVEFHMFQQVFFLLPSSSITELEK